MTGWRAFVGDTHGEWSSVDVGGLSWENARDRLLAELRPMLGDDCLDCRMQAAEAHEDLRLLDAATAEEWWVDGTLYRIGPDTSTTPPSGGERSDSQMNLEGRTDDGH